MSEHEVRANNEHGAFLAAKQREVVGVDRTDRNVSWPTNRTMH